MLTGRKRYLHLKLFTKKAAWGILMASLALLAFLQGGCTGEAPDTSAPQRQIIERTADWQGALLYVADQSGPNPAFGSVRIYDNVSGFVEITVDQTMAAAPADIYVTPDGGTMYVAGSYNGRIDKFRWDGNSWIRGGITIDTPAQSITAMIQGPDEKLYFTANDGESPGKIYQLDINVDRVEDVPLSVPQIADLRGIAWSPDGKTVFLSGTGQDQLPRLYLARWPSLEILSRIDLTGTLQSGQVVVSLDGGFAYVMAEGHVYIVNAVSSSVTGELAPSENIKTSYSDGVLSADGRYLFVTGNLAGEQASLFIVDLSNNTLVKKVGHVAETARGIQRVE